MASLLAAVKDGRLRVPSSMVRGDAFQRYLTSRVTSPDTPKVNIQPIAELIFEQWEGISLSSARLEDVRLPFQAMWMEMTPPGTGIKAGVLATRDALTERATTSLRAAMGPPGTFERLSGSVAVSAQILRFFIRDASLNISLAFDAVYLLDAFGEIVEVSHGNALGCLADEAQPFFVQCQLTALEALVHMNTAGTRIDPPWEKSPVRAASPDRKRFSVWHTISVGGRQPSRRSAGAVDGEGAIARREHWVRAHRADYRRGAGLFGRINQLIWIQEHKRGDAELGRVMADYVVQVGRKV